MPRFAELVQVRNGPRMVFAGYIRGNALRLPLFEILDQRVGMRVGVQCDELDQRVVFQDEADELGGLRFI